jgi:hypothetical protein
MRAELVLGYCGSLRVLAASIRHHLTDLPATTDRQHLILSVSRVVADHAEPTIKQLVTDAELARDSATRTRLLHELCDALLARATAISLGVSNVQRLVQHPDGSFACCAPA